MRQHRWLGDEPGWRLCVTCGRPEKVAGKECVIGFLPTEHEPYPALNEITDTDRLDAVERNEWTLVHYPTEPARWAVNLDDRPFGDSAFNVRDAIDAAIRREQEARNAQP